MVSGFITWSMLVYVLCIAILYYLSACLPAADIINIHEQNSHIVKLV